MVNLFFLVLISYLFSVVSGSNQSSGILKEDWKIINQTIEGCELELFECIKKATLTSLEDVATITKKFYIYKKEEYIKNIQFDIQYSYIVENYFRQNQSKSSQDQTNGTQCNESDIKEKIQSSDEWTKLHDNIYQKYIHDFDVVIENCLSLLKELIYFNDNDFYNSYNTIIKSHNFKEIFYNKTIETFLNSTFDKLFAEY